MKYLVELTRSQQMALIDLIAHSMRCSCDNAIDEYLDMSSSPVVRTTPGELLRHISDAQPYFQTSESRNS